MVAFNNITLSFTFHSSISSAAKHCLPGRQRSKCHFEMAEFVNLCIVCPVFIHPVPSYVFPMRKVFSYCEDSCNNKFFIITTLARINVLEKKNSNRTLSISNSLLKFLCGKHYMRLQIQ